MIVKRKVVYIVILLVSHVVFFIGGDLRGKHVAMDFFVRNIKSADSEVAVGRYMIYRDIVSNIKIGKSERAICSAELEASGYLDEIKSCLASRECRGSIDKVTRKVAPEAFGEIPLKFNYWSKSEGGVRQCEDKNSQR